MWSPKRPVAHIALSAQRIAVAQASNIWFSKNVKFEKIDCEPDDGREVWSSAVDGLERWLSVQRNKPTLHIVLSARFVRWQLLDWRPEVSHPKEIAAYAALRFKETYGKTVEDWQVRYASQPPGQTVPACAIDVALIDRLRTVCSNTGARLISISPYFSSALDRWSSSLKGEMCWLGVVETDCISLALLRNGRFLGLRSQRIDVPLREALPGLVTQMGIACGITDATVPIYLVGDGEVSSLPGDMAFTWLQSRTQQRKAPVQVGLHMALGM